MEKARMTREKRPFDGYKDVNYGKEADRPKIIEIQIIRRKHLKEDYLHGAGVPRDGYHYYIFYAQGPSNEKPGNINELGKNFSSGKFPGTRNCTNTSVFPGQKIKWICLFPFTVYFGGNSIITTDKFGWPRPYQILPYLKASTRDSNGAPLVLDDNRIPYYATQDAYIVNNALSGDYKYNVSVYIPEADVICVDDPQNSVPRPPGA